VLAGFLAVLRVYHDRPLTFIPSVSLNRFSTLFFLPRPFAQMALALVPDKKQAVIHHLDKRQAARSSRDMTQL
jgi:hypothetical protein